MEVLVLLVFVSLMLALSAVGMFAWLVRQRTFDHADRLSLLALEPDSGRLGRGRRSKPLDLGPSCEPESE